MEQTIFDDEQHAISGFMWVWTEHRKGFPPSSFAECLMNAFIRADGDNFRRLASVYPAYAKAYEEVKKLEG